MKTNEQLTQLITELKRKSASEKVGLWKAIAINLERPTRQRAEVNIFRLNKFTKDNEFVIVPGKVLSSGELDHKVNVAAVNFSQIAKEKIMRKGACLTIQELMSKNPKGKDVRLIR